MSELAIHGGEPASKKLIPMAKPTFSQKAIQEVAEILKSGHVVQGPKTKAFEDAFRDKVGARYAYAVNSGTAALHVSFLSFLKLGDEVIIPAFTFIAIASTVLHSKGRPVFSDIDPGTYIIDPEDIKNKITGKTRAIAPVHLFGNAADMKAIDDLASDHSLMVVNDSAQAHGTQLHGKDIGSLDHLNCFSFYPSKTMTTAEGGIVTTNEKKLDNVGRLIRAHGDQARYNHTILGLNYRMTEIMAVLGMNQLSRLDDFLEKRRRFGKTLHENISRIDGLHPQRIEAGVTPSYSYFTLTMNPSKFKCSRDEICEALRAENISCAVHYPIPLTKQPAITSLMKPDPCPVSEETSKRIFSLPMHPELTEDDLNNVIKGVKKVATYYHK